ncbi:ribosome small subunit-dependent GTPase A [Granulosicoccus sp. 3-233]|uniref:ribosome small subunit-dependent GTPase A n=1 Tax=Granulosicoccus sp. 3-233 TaxID=3417969 RepID=UPI003D329374
MNAELSDLGLSPFFTRQLTLEEMEHGQLARVFQVQRSGLVLGNGSTTWALSPGQDWYDRPAEQRVTVGDWLVLDESGNRLLRLLDRKSVFKRMAPGTKVEVQLLAANIDTLFVVTSCNEEFKESRLERYLALAREADVDPVIVLTKADLTQDSRDYVDRALRVSECVPIERVNALDGDSLENLKSWTSRGSTIALAGSSGVGKSTLLNSLAGRTLAQTAAIREQDAKGRHTTTYRELHILPSGGLMLDLPGIREVRLAEVGDAVRDVFEDIEALSLQCRFSNCRHHDEPGCAVRLAISSGQLDERRLRNYEKLAREDARNSATLAEQRQQDKAFGKMVKQHMAIKKRR